MIVRCCNGNCEFGLQVHVTVMRRIATSAGLSFAIPRLRSTSLRVSAFRPLRPRAVVIAHQVQHAVNHVQQQFVVRRPTVVAARLRRAVSAPTITSPSRPSLVVQQKTQHVGRAAVAEILPVEPGDRGVVDHGHADPGLAHAGLAEHRSHGPPQQPPVQRQMVCWLAIWMAMAGRLLHAVAGPKEITRTDRTDPSDLPSLMRSVVRDISAVHDRLRRPT